MTAGGAFACHACGGVDCLRGLPWEPGGGRRLDIARSVGPWQRSYGTAPAYSCAPGALHTSRGPGNEAEPRAFPRVDHEGNGRERGPLRTKHRVHLDPECGYLHRGDGSSDPLPLVWSFVISTYGTVQTCQYCLDRIKREREAREW